MGHEMITDEVFEAELEKHLKAQKINNKLRQAKIYYYFGRNITERDVILDIEEKKAREFTKKETIPKEDDEQINFVKQFRREYPGVDLFMVRNDGTRTPAEKNKQLLMGLLPGVSDLISLQFCMCIEMKRTIGGRQSDDQKAWEKYCKSIGFKYILAIGCDDGMAKVRQIVAQREIT
jgi:hypothetical protein